MLAPAIRVHTVTEVDIGTIVFADNALGVIVEKLRRDAPQLFNEIGIVLKVGVVWHGVYATEAIRRIDR